MNFAFNIIYIPYIVIAVGFLIYSYLLFQKIKEIEDGYYAVLFKSLRGLALLPFWVLGIIFTIYLYNDNVKFIFSSHPKIQSIIIRNDTSKEQSFYLLKNDNLKGKYLNHNSKWVFAHLLSDKFKPTFNIKPRVESKFYFYCHSSGKQRFFLFIVDKEEKWKSGSLGKFFNADGKNYFFYASEIIERELKPKPNVDEELQIIGFYLFILYGLFFHAIDFGENETRKWRRISIISSLSLLPLWIIYNSSIALWIKFFG